MIASHKIVTGRDLGCLFWVPNLISVATLHYIDNLFQDCSNSSGLERELLQSCTKPLICSVMLCCFNIVLSIFKYSHLSVVDDSGINQLDFLAERLLLSSWYICPPVNWSPSVSAITCRELHESVSKYLVTFPNYQKWVWSDYMGGIKLLCSWSNTSGFPP